MKAAEHQQDFGYLQAWGSQAGGDLRRSLVLPPAQRRASSEARSSCSWLAAFRAWNPPQTGMAKTLGVTSLPMGTPRKKLLLKPSLNLLQLVLLVSRPPSLRRCDRPGSISSRTSCGCSEAARCFQSHPFSRLPFSPTPSSQCECSSPTALGPPKHLPACPHRSCVRWQNQTQYLNVVWWVTQTGTIPSLDHLAALPLTLPRLFVSSNSDKKKWHQDYKEAKPPYGFKMTISTSMNSREAIFPNWNNLTHCSLY